jgi:hypothetical protein
VAEIERERRSLTELRRLRRQLPFKETFVGAADADEMVSDDHFIIVNRQMTLDQFNLVWRF